jgi:hypothetical protein
MLGFFSLSCFLIPLGSRTVYAGSEGAQLAVRPGPVYLIYLQAHMLSWHAGLLLTAVMKDTAESL